MTFELRCVPYTLELRDRFTLANSSRTTTPTRTRRRRWWSKG